MIKKICILTKSVKDSGYCVAGIDVENKNWIRLVSSKDGDAIPKELLDNAPKSIKELNYSLLMFEAQNVIFDTSLKGDGRHHHKISFQYKGNTYKASLTDPNVRKEALDSFPLKKAIIIMSIPAVSYGEKELHYKFVAKIFPCQI